jgi:MFS family permease
MGTFAAAGIIPAYQTYGLPGTFVLPSVTDHETRIASDFGVSVNDASYLTSIQIAVLGVAPIFWKPLSNRWGRRPIFLLSLICSLVCNVGCAESTSYASTAVCRALQAFFISPASGETPFLFS